MIYNDLMLWRSTASMYFNEAPIDCHSLSTLLCLLYIISYHILPMNEWIANIYIQIAESSVLLKGSEIWGAGKPNEREGQKAITRAATWTCVIGAILYIVTTVVVGKLTDPLDNRTNSIVVGLSEIFAAIIFCMMSVNIPQWFGVYHSNKTTAISFTSGREIRFNLSWNLWKQLMSMYFFNLYFSCADFDLCILYGALSKYCILFNSFSFSFVSFRFVLFCFVCVSHFITHYPHLRVFFFSIQSGSQSELLLCSLRWRRDRRATRCINENWLFLLLFYFQSGAGGPFGLGSGISWKFGIRMRTIFLILQGFFSPWFG